MTPNSFSTKVKKFLTVTVAAAALLAGFLQITAKAQQEDDRLSLVDIVVALRSKKATIAERNKILADAARQRGITFSATPQIESELTAAGADADLIAAIREKSVIIKTAAAKPQQEAPDASFYQKRGQASAAKGDFKTALTDFNIAALMAPDTASIYMDRGLVNFNLKDFEATTADYTKAIELDDKNAKAYFNRALSLEVLGKVDEAYTDFKKAAELDPANMAAKASVKRIDDDRAAKAAELQAKQNPPVPEPSVQPQEETKAAVSEPLAKPEFVSLGTLSRADAIALVMPVYPALAKNMRLTGKITVAIELDEKGEVTRAEATEGQRVLRQAAEDAARKSKFKPANWQGQPVKARGFVVYNFTANGSE
jgi:TonB family protein